MNKIRISQLLQLIKSDVEHFIYPLAYPNNRKLTIKNYIIAFLSVEFRLVLSYRIQSFFFNKGYTKFAMLMYLSSKKKYCSDIHPKATIGKGFRIGHSFNIVIGPDVIIGENVIIFNGVTLGNRDVKKENQMPIIGDNILIGTGAKVLGGIRIGNNVKIGANAVVLQSIKDNQTFVGAPICKIITNDNN